MDTTVRLLRHESEASEKFKICNGTGSTDHRSASPKQNPGCASPNNPAQLSEGVSLQEMASLITKRTRTAGDGDLHQASTKNSDGTHHCNHAERQINVPPCPFLEGRW